MRALLSLTLTAAAFVAAAFVAAGCASRAPSAAASAGAPPPADTLAAGVSVLREPGGGGLLVVTLPPEATGVSATRARLVTPSATFDLAAGELELDVAASPARALVRYTATEAALRALDAAGVRARLDIYDGTAYRPYRIRRTDTVE